MEQLTKEEILDLSRTCYQSTEKAAKILFPERFNRPFDDPHLKIFDLIDNSDKQKIVIAAPRGTGKTSIMNLLVPAKKLAFLDTNFIVPVSSTASSAEQQSENLKHEFMHNKVLKTIFPIQKTSNFSKKQWVVELAGDHRAMIWPKGAGTQVRGMLFGNSRPDLVIVDDLENDENLRSEEQRKKLKEWFFGPLLNIVDRSSDKWQIIYIDTLKHEDSLLQDLIEDDNWDSLVLELFDDDYKSNYPNMISDEGVQKLVDEYRAQDKLDVLYREYRNLPVATEDRPIQQSHFQYLQDLHQSKMPDFKADYMETVIVIDPAKTAKMQSADSAIVGGSIDMRDGYIYFRDIIAGKWHPDELYKEMIAMIRRLKPTVVGVEVTGLNEFVTYPIKNELIKHAPMVRLQELHARGGIGEPGKVARVRSLVSFYRQGLIWHNKYNSGGLEAQLLSFPKSKRWDIMDAAAYFVEMFERGQKYAAVTQDTLESRKEVEEEYSDLASNPELRNPLVVKDLWER